MKYFFALSFLLIAGCSTSTEPANPYAPGGKYFVAPGTFTGTWCISYITADTIITDTNHCTAVITEADSLLVATVTNDSTKEVLTISGYHTVVIVGGLIAPLHNYDINVKSSIGDTNFPGVIPFGFYPGGDTLQFVGGSLVPATSINIFCERKG